MALELFVTKATLLVDEAGNPSRHKGRMVWDVMIAGISNDIVLGKIIKKGPDVTLAQVLESSSLETVTQQMLSQISNTKPSVNYVKYNKKRKDKGGKTPQQQSLGKFHGPGSSPSNSKPEASKKFQTKAKSAINVRMADISQIRNVVPLMQSETNMERKAIMQVSVKRERDFHILLGLHM